MEYHKDKMGEKTCLKKTRCTLPQFEVGEEVCVLELEKKEGNKLGNYEQSGLDLQLFYIRFLDMCGESI